MYHAAVEMAGHYMYMYVLTVHIHCLLQDLAARNVLVDRDETTKVADFGLSRETVEEVYEVTKVCNQDPL